MSFWKKDTKAELVDDTGVGTAADVEAVMKKYDRESNTRMWEGAPKLLVRCIMVAFSLWSIYITLFSTALPEFRLSCFLAAVLIMGYLNFPARKNHVKVNSMPWYDILIMVLGAGAFSTMPLMPRGSSSSPCGRPRTRCCWQSASLASWH